MKARALMLKANEHSVVTLRHPRRQRNSFWCHYAVNGTRQGSPLRPLDRRRGHQGVGGRGGPLLGPAVKRVWVRCPDLFGDADSVRVVPQRTSNAYHFNDPGGAGAASILNKQSASALSPKSRLEYRTKCFSS